LDGSFYALGAICVRVHCHSAGTQPDTPATVFVVPAIHLGRRGLFRDPRTPPHLLPINDFSLNASARSRRRITVSLLAVPI
jgi:hypothetical protein